MASVKSIINKKKAFGRGFAFKYYLYSALSKINKRYIFKKHATINKYLDKKYGHLISECANAVGETGENIIWVFWWQGLETAPELVKCCIQNLQKTADAKVVVITKDNFLNYVNIPDHVLQKLKDNKFSLTHFSDILRMSLLTEHGGFWADATIFTYNTDLSEYFNKDFFTIKKHEKTYMVPQNRWAGYFMRAKKGNYLTTTARNIFFEYWKDHDELIHYFLIDYVINLIYTKSNCVKQMIDDVEYSNPNIEKLSGVFNQPFDQQQFDDLVSQTKVFKLTWKETFNKTADGKPTFYSKFLEITDHAK